MKTCSVCKIEKPPAEFHAKPSGRFGVCGTCKECTNAKSRAYQAANKETLAAKSATYREANRERANAREKDRYAREGDRIRERNRGYYARHKKQRSAYNRDWRIANQERLAKEDATRSYIKNYAYRLNNPEKWRAIMAAAVSRRRAARINATPAWANLKAIRDLYLACQIISEMSGVQHHVDHIVPLVSPLVCGLHVEYNLQILPAGDNLAKSNKFEVVTTCPR